MAEDLPPNHIEANIGDVSGGSQVAVGNYIVQIGRIEGGVVNIMNSPLPPPRLRPQPVSLRPKAFPGILDRETETMNAIGALQSNDSVECSGEPGVGKTILLRHLAYHPQLSAFASGVIYFQVNEQSNADLLQSLFEAFYEYGSPVKLTETEVRNHLKSLNALILLDDVNTSSEQMKSLMTMAPGCTFVMATTTRLLLGETRDVSLKGLPTGDAVNLFERELGRSLSDAERRGAQYLCESVDCIPRRVLRAAHQTREENRSIVDVVPMTKSASLDKALAAAEVKPRSEDEKKVLYALATFYGAAVATEHVAALAGISGVATILEDFEQRGLVQEHEQRYVLAGDVKNALSGDLQSWLARALAYFADWTEEYRDKPKLIAESAQPILLVLTWAVAAERWQEVRRLGHAVEEALALSGKWDMWATALQSILKAAEVQEDRAEAAWAHHQLGTRALCLEDRATAKAALTDALSLREALNDQRGAEATRHNLEILLKPLPSKRETDKGSGGNISPGPAAAPMSLKLGAIALSGVLLTAALIVWWFRSAKPPVPPVNVVSFSVSPTIVSANGQAQLCYEVQNAESFRIEPGLGERKSPTSECLTVAPEQTTIYTLTATGLDGNTISKQVTLNVEKAPPLVEIRSFEVKPEPGTRSGDVQFRLCYEVRNAAHAKIEPDLGDVVLNQKHCQRITPEGPTKYILTATGSDGIPVRREATADATRPPSPPPQVLSFASSPPKIDQGGSSQLCYELKDVSSGQVDPGGRQVETGSGIHCVEVAPLNTTTYTLTALNSEGKSATKTATVGVTPRLPKIISFTGPESVGPEDMFDLCYETSDATRVEIDHSVRVFTPPNKGCARAVIGDNPVTYTLTATGQNNQTVKKSVTVAVIHPPITISFHADRKSVERGGSVTLCYLVENAKAFTIDQGIGTKFDDYRSGERCIATTLTKTTTFTLTATAFDGQTQTRQVTVDVLNPVTKHAQIIFFTASDTQINAGERVKLCYRVLDAEQIEISPLNKVLPRESEHCEIEYPQQSTTYILKATGSDNQPVTSKEHVNVKEPDKPVPITIKSFTPRLQLIDAGGEAKICYSTSGEGAAEILPQPGQVPTSEKESCRTVSPKLTTVYTLTVKNSAGQQARKITVRVRKSRVELR